MTFTKIFHQLTGFSPYPWQERMPELLAQWDTILVKAPTGAGKEAGAVIPWLVAGETARLIYALPTRSLVDQVYKNVSKLAERHGLGQERVYCLKGGQIEQGYEDSLCDRAIIIGTQDQVLTRALNRGFSVSWSQRPKQAAAMNNDCTWVLDETQLMGVGYKSAVQLQKLRQRLGCYGRSQLICMSATLDAQVVEQAGLSFAVVELEEADRSHPFLGQKLRKPKPLTRVAVASVGEIVALVEQVYCADGLTLVVVNQVKRVREIGQRLRERGLSVLEVHSRFLGGDRSRLQDQIYDFKGVLVATQVVEAGVDLDARTLITELCPWSSFVQRVGRLGRTKMEQESQAYWLDWQDPQWSVLPYEQAELDQCRQRLESLGDVGLLSLAAVESPPIPARGPVLRERILKEHLFCTTSDGRNFDGTVHEYVRELHNFTVRVCWSDRLPQHIPGALYLCPVPLRELQQLLGAQVCHRWGDGDLWQRVTADALKVGDVVVVPVALGGYSRESGWTGNPEDRFVPEPILEKPWDSEFYGGGKFKLSLKLHSADAEGFLRSFVPVLQRLGLTAAEVERLARCARWHDWGKAHGVWQAYAGAAGEILAKGERYGHPEQLQGFRHELASALAARAQGVDFLSVYLIAAHHGKVRETLIQGRFAPDCPYGVRFGSVLPAVELGEEVQGEVVLGWEGSLLGWDDGVVELVEEYGPFRLWFLEALVRNADVQASMLRSREAESDLG